MVNPKDLLAYNVTIRHSYLDALTTLPWAEVEKNREASYHSLRDIFLHVLDGINYWLDVLQGEKLRQRPAFDEFTSIEQMRAFMQEVESRLHAYLEELPSDGLTRTFSLQNDAGEEVEVTAEDILIHLFEEEVHHRGEMIALLWQMDVEPPLMGWKYL